MKKRFQDPNLSMRIFMSEVWVHCPKCEKKAIVYYYHPIKICCEHCGYYEQNNKLSFHLEVKRHCPTCGKFFLFSIPNIRARKEKIRLSCPHCQTAEDYQPRYEVQYLSHLGIDAEPFYFNSRLWLQKTIKGERFFALNGRHLQYLKHFIAADLREKNPFYAKTYLAYLPKFIKLKKNRALLLRTIRQLEEKALL